MLGRRSFLGGVAALPLLTQQIHARALGDAMLTTVSDGSLTLPGNFIYEPMPQDELPGLIETFGLSRETLTPECNLALYRDGTHTVLFDVGAGPDFMPSAGTLLDSLDQASVAPEDITHVVFTHAHPDHIWGLIDEFDELLIPDATYMMGRAEWDYWWNPETVNTIGEARASFAVGAKRRMEFLEDSVEFFEDGEEFLTGIQAVATHGHTPGHMSFEVRSGSDSAMILGDAIGNHHIALARPDWPSGADGDFDKAIETRRRLLDRVTAEQMTVVGFHLPSGGVGRIEKAAEGYRFVAENA
ncbi:MAG: MBL fold metallo-hydrolase [Pseudomonadota bacterium]